MVQNAGARVSIQSLLSWPALDEMRYILYGDGFLSCLWCERIRPALFPVRQAALEQAYQIVKEQVRREYIEALLKENNE